MHTRIIDEVTTASILVCILFILYMEYTEAKACIVLAIANNISLIFSSR
jgi:conjugal transfer/entry exclusion protein